MKKRSHNDEGTRQEAGFSLNRRQFLQALGGGIIIFFSQGTLPAQERRAPGAQQLPSDFNAYLRIAPDGQVSCFTGKIEMGQGIVTSLAQILAEELDVSVASVEMVMGDTDLCPWDNGTFGSLTTRFFAPPSTATSLPGDSRGSAPFVGALGALLGFGLWLARPRRGGRSTPPGA